MRKILIIDDETGIESFVRSALSSIGFEILWKSCALDAIEALKRDPSIELIMSDHDLGGAMSGLDLWGQCKRDFPSIPFILISGFPGDVFYKLLKLGVPCPTFLLKPFTSAECREVVQNTLKVNPHSIKTQRDASSL